MPEFLLRYKMPKTVESPRDIVHFRAQVDEMAIKVQRKIGEIFKLNVIWEAREFEHSNGMPDFYVTAWLTDNEDESYRPVNAAESEILRLKQELTYENQTVACWFMRVKGKWGHAHGLKL